MLKDKALLHIKGGIQMNAFKIILQSVNDVKDFVNTVSKFNYDIDLVSGRYVVDAKSIMGIFSLDLTKPIEVRVFADEFDNLYSEIERFII